MKDMDISSQLEELAIFADDLALDAKKAAARHEELARRLNALADIQGVDRGSETILLLAQTFDLGELLAAASQIAAEKADDRPQDKHLSLAWLALSDMLDACFSLAKGIENNPPLPLSTASRGAVPSRNRTTQS